MKLLEPENSWVKLDFIQECISSIQKLTQNDMKDSMLANLDYINRQIVKHGGEEFYITDTEARAFFSTPEAIRFKIKFIERQREAIKFYDTVFGASNQDDSENFVFRIDSLPKLAELSDRKDIQEKGISKFNSNLEEVEFVYMNYERTLYANAMFLIETCIIVLGVSRTTTT
ncbi:hypothetical protein BY996DRAFT_6418093 [Phakopsora pachyrhizi]|nr:hypothetical protein BY996DRAFT_6418093 [Phakopsora pachyrhizi]